MKKIAFLFLIYDILNLEELWRYFFLNVDKNKYTIYIHFTPFNISNAEVFSKPHKHLLLGLYC